MIRCPRCGNLTEPNRFRRNLCDACFGGVVRSETSTGRVVYCGVCGAVKRLNHWRTDLTVDDIRRQASAGTPTKPITSHPIRPTSSSKFEGSATFNGLELVRSICTNCTIAKTKAYLFEVKIRVEGRAMSTREVMYLTDLVEGLLDSLDDRNFVHDYSETKDGVDVLLSTRKTAERLLKEMRSRFLGRENRSYKLVGETHDKRRIYRTTFSYRILPLTEGALLRIDSQLCSVTKFRGGFLVAADMQGREHKFRTSDVFQLYKRGKIEVIRQSDPIISLSRGVRYA
ncbi:MAG: NMD3-related protein [Thermoprotei archaeon]